MAEWSKAHAWKVCIPHKGIKGSNPFLSAISKQILILFIVIKLITVETKTN